MGVSEIKLCRYDWLVGFIYIDPGLPNPPLRRKGIKTNPLLEGRCERIGPDEPFGAPPHPWPLSPLGRGEGNSRLNSLAPIGGEGGPPGGAPAEGAIGGHSEFFHTFRGAGVGHYIRDRIYGNALLGADSREVLQSAARSALADSLKELPITG